MQNLFTSSEEFFGPGLDAVVVASPAPCHKQNVLDAARHGIHVLCEKPLAMNKDDAITMISAMEVAGLMFFTSFCYRFSPVSMTIGRLIDDGTIGRIKSLRFSFIWNLWGKYQGTNRGIWCLTSEGSPVCSKEGRWLTAGFT